MPIRPQPEKLTCSHCGRTRVVQQTSDMICIPTPAACDRCGNNALKRSIASSLDVLTAQLTGRYLSL